MSGYDMMSGVTNAADGYVIDDFVFCLLAKIYVSLYLFVHALCSARCLVMHLYFSDRARTSVSLRVRRQQRHHRLRYTVITIIVVVLVIYSLE